MKKVLALALFLATGIALGQTATPTPTDTPTPTITPTPTPTSTRTPQAAPLVTPRPETVYTLYAMTDVGDGTTVEIGGFSANTIQVFSSSTSTSTVLIQTRIDPAAPWVTSNTVTNADSTGELIVLPRSSYARARVSAIAGGTIFALISRQRFPTR